MGKFKRVGKKSILKDLSGITDGIYSSIIIRGGTVKYSSELIEIFEIINDINFGLRDFALPLNVTI
jgi:hypothetical protein